MKKYLQGKLKECRFEMLEIRVEIVSGVKEFEGEWRRDREI